MSSTEPMNSSEPTTRAANGPLHGVRVLEFAGLGPAPFCGMLLSDLGAGPGVFRVPRGDSDELLIKAEKAPNAAAARLLGFEEDGPVGEGGLELDLDEGIEEVAPSATALFEAREHLVQGKVGALALLEETDRCLGLLGRELHPAHHAGAHAARPARAAHGGGRRARHDHAQRRGRTHLRHGALRT